MREEAIADWGTGGYFGGVIFEEMLLWVDPVRRPGPEAMAVDEWLLETAELPVLRVYGWLGEWASVGSFGEIAGARAALLTCGSPSTARRVRVRAVPAPSQY